MVARTVQDDIFNSEIKHIAFAVNVEGINNAGFAGQVSSKYWNELANYGECELGTVLSKTVGNKTFHALVCHSLNNGWGENQSEIIRECFDKIPANGEPIATIAIGTGIVGMMELADFRQIVCGMHESQQQIVLYAGYTLDAVINCYNEEKRKQNLAKEKELALESHKKLALELHRKGLL